MTLSLPTIVLEMGIVGDLANKAFILSFAGFFVLWLAWCLNGDYSL